MSVLTGLSILSNQYLLSVISVVSITDYWGLLLLAYTRYSRDFQRKIWKMIDAYARLVDSLHFKLCITHIKVLALNLSKRQY